MTKPLRLGLASALVALLCLPAWAGASQAKAKKRVAWKTPQAMATKIHGFIPQIRVDNTSAPSIISSTTCRGLGKAHKRGKGKKAVRKYSRFRCTATWELGKHAVWARALPGGKFCASSTGLASCPAAAPEAGDPRICGNPPAPPSADPNNCVLAATEASVSRAMKVWFKNPDWTPGNVHCKGSNLKFGCTYQQLNVFGVYYTSKIRFKLTNGAWAATLATTGGSGPASTCTVLPNAKTRAGKPSKWTTGPTPTCS
jgi:hypothetical protein